MKIIRPVEEAEVPQALRGAWEVQAGILPGTPMPELTKCFAYTSEDYEADLEKGPEEMTTFTALMVKAHAYSQELTNPQRLNWVRVDWIWY